jgi:hypothetical protein
LVLMTVNPRTALSFYKNQMPGGSEPDGAPQSADTDLHAHWDINNSILTMTYDGDATSRFTCEIRCNAKYQVLAFPSPQR